MSLSPADACLNAVPTNGQGQGSEIAREPGPGVLNRKRMSKKMRKVSAKNLKRLQRRIARAEARGDFRAAERLRRLISKSYYIRVGMLVEEMDRQNGRRRPRPQSTGEAGSPRCNSLQRDRSMLTDITWHDEELAPNEVLIENDVVKLGRDCVSARRWRLTVTWTRRVWRKTSIWERRLAISTRFSR
ncbi:hypothetical protein ABIA24_000628 [Sinorhizobium fredii]|uniref:Uncharacterized protein n=1 Tax=Rhizobium fredii TaxID=380 RepID=A0A844AG46_RHIFR|nr:hypothetical protein [Sinorhizobium fredii]MQX12144.1 hypothetical protein [Sinorhizobium fredii]GEC34895.1 hypothetical protein EFR01_50660 [Sinorhizobium fredii]GLS08336.1 hypothetical protein GCM10007864_19650 [Sinorhizobium fredii]